MNNYNYYIKTVSNISCVCLGDLNTANYAAIATSQDHQNN